MAVTSRCPESATEIDGIWRSGLIWRRFCLAVCGCAWSIVLNSLLAFWQLIVPAENPGICFSTLGMGTENIDMNMHEHACGKQPLARFLTGACRNIDEIWLLNCLHPFPPLLAKGTHCLQLPQPGIPEFPLMVLSGIQT